MDTSKIIKKVGRVRMPRKTIKKTADKPKYDNWVEVTDIRQLKSVGELGEVVLEICKKIGLRVEINRADEKVRVSDYLTEEQETALLGDSD